MADGRVLIAEARELVADLPSASDVLDVSTRIALAQAKASIAIAEQLRVQNLISFGDYRLGRSPAKLTAEIRGELGLEL